MAINLRPGSLGGDFGSTLAQRGLGGAELLFRGLGSLGRMGLKLSEPKREAEKFTLLAEADREAEIQKKIGQGLSREQAMQEVREATRAELDRFMAQTDLFQAQAGGARGREGRAGAIAPFEERTAAAGATTAEAASTRAGEEVGSEAQLLRSLARQLDITKIGESLDPETRAALERVQDLELGQRGAEAKAGKVVAETRERTTPELTDLGIRGERARVEGLEAQSQMQKVRSQFFEEFEEVRLMKLGDEGVLLSTQIRIADQQLNQNEDIFEERLRLLRSSPDPSVVQSTELLVRASAVEGREIDGRISAAINKVRGIIKVIESTRDKEIHKVLVEETLKNANDELSTAMGQKNQFLAQALKQIEQITSGTATVPTGGGTPGVGEGLDRLGR